MIVGEYASAARAVSYGDTVGQFEELQLLEQRQIPSIGVSVDYPTTFSREFNDVIWDNTAGSWIAIGFGGSVFTGVGIGTTAISDYYGKYSWGRIYDFQNRIAGQPKNFIVNPDAGLVGLSTAAQIFRTRPLT